ncbi:uncharacterized protein LOC113515661 isoform X2 [Galleria mellonella]|uniref:Uncharacterized protein LOC113515661 isoform X2 n=1 Tax=Galleria mellonella TaxID=7137 RepID=A0ABM3MCQ1_GALME|nr:uncharacterized protein LOC113515661 isoform X2 [Galleria mellonella]
MPPLSLAAMYKMVNTKKDMLYNPKEWDKKDLLLVKLVQRSRMLYDSGKNKAYYWSYFSRNLGLSPNECQRRWNLILKSYKSIKLANSQGGNIVSPLLDGNLEFLDELLLWETSSQIDLTNENVSEKEETNYIVTLDMIENILNQRDDCNFNIDPDDIEMKNIFNMVNNRIMEALNVSKSSTTTNAVTDDEIQLPKITLFRSNNLMPCAESNAFNTGMNLLNDATDSSALALLNDGSKRIIDTPDQADACLEESDLKPMQAICIKSATPSINIGQLKPNYKVNMNRRQDALLLHNCNNCKTPEFFKQLGSYLVNNISEEKQMELRLKICSLVTAELEQ